MRSWRWTHDRLLHIGTGRLDWALWHASKCGPLSRAFANDVEYWRQYEGLGVVTLQPDVLRGDLDERRDFLWAGRRQYGFELVL